MSAPAPLSTDLVDGYCRFRATRYATERERYRRFEAEGQHPTTVVIACSDSRSGPETIFDALPGELFAVLALGVHAIIVPGHRSVEQSIVNLRTFPWIRSRETAGTLALAGAWFDIALGELHGLTRMAGPRSTE